MTKVSVPTKVEDVFRLAGLIYAKHTALGEASPLKALDWETGKANLDAAEAQNTAFKELHRQAEAAREERDHYVAQIRLLVQQSRDMLKGIHRNDLRQLGEYGFEVND